MKITDILITESVDVQRLKQLIHYYVDGWGGFPDNPDIMTRKVMAAVQHLQDKDLTRLTPREEEMAQNILMYGGDV